MASAERIVNPLLSKSVVLISTKILTPQANFTITPNAAAGNYTVKLSVTGDTGEKAVKSIVVKVL